jgi:hypothetical protein
MWSWLDGSGHAAAGDSLRAVTAAAGVRIGPCRARGCCSRPIGHRTTAPPRSFHRVTAIAPAEPLPAACEERPRVKAGRKRTRPRRLKRSGAPAAVERARSAPGENGPLGAAGRGGGELGGRAGARSAAIRPVGARSTGLGRNGLVGGRLRRSACLAWVIGQGDFGRLGAWPGPEVLVGQPVGVAFEGKDLGVVDEPVDHRDGGHIVAEDLAPGGERLVGDDDQRGALVAARHGAEHQVGGLGVERDVPHPVDHEQRNERQPPELGVEVVVALGLGEAGDPLGGGRAGDELAGEAGADRDGDREIRLAGARRVVAEPLMLRIRGRSGCGWLTRPASCAALSLRSSVGAPRMVRRRWCAGWPMAALARSRRAGLISSGASTWSRWWVGWVSGGVAVAA